MIDMFSFKLTDFEEPESPPFTSNLLLSWLSRYPSAVARREEAERLAAMTESELDTLGLSRAEIEVYLGRKSRLDA